jgi:hypothetical protein
VGGADVLPPRGEPMSYLLIVGVVFALSGLAYAWRSARPSSRTR